MFISKDYIEKYNKSSFPNKNNFGEFVYLRTYSRFLENEGRRETWAETVARVVNYSLSLYTGPASPEELKKEAEELFDFIYNLKVFPAGRTLWLGGTKAAEKYPFGNFNCSFLIIDNLNNIVELMYALMVGSGVGFRVLFSDVEKLPKINSEIQIAHKPYDGKKKKEREEKTLVFEEEGDVLIVVGDSREGWTEALRKYFEFLQRDDIQSIIFSYDNVRPQGERLKTFGGRASGHGAIKNIFKGIQEIILKRKTGRNKMISLKPIDVLDICNIIGYGIVVGGVRRTAQICLFSPDDEEILNAKKGLYDKDSPNYNKYWRAMSNNSIFFERKPEKDYLRRVFENIKINGEPGFINHEAMKKRRPNAQGVNPCSEIILDSKGVCNLTEVNVLAFVDKENKSFYWEDLLKAVRLATRIGLRQTNVTLELPEWDRIQKRDRLLGVSITGYCDAMDILGYDEESQKTLLYNLKKTAREEAIKYAYEMRVPIPLLVTAIKPSGTISQLPTVSSGAHRSYAPYFIRRVRISRTDPLAKVALDCGYRVYPEAGNGISPEEFDSLNNFDKIKMLSKASVWVIEFPLKSEAKMSFREEKALDQLKRYFLFQKFYTEHNTSITINVGEDEWEEVLDYLYENWDDYVGVSFLPKADGSYPLMPYEEITGEEYEKRIKEIKFLDFYEELKKYENIDGTTDIIDFSCETGVCPVR